MENLIEKFHENIKEDNNTDVKKMMKTEVVYTSNLGPNNNNKK